MSTHVYKTTHRVLHFDIVVKYVNENLFNRSFQIPIPTIPVSISSVSTNPSIRFAIPPYFPNSY